MEQYWWIIIAAVLIVVGLLKMVIMKKYKMCIRDRVARVKAQLRRYKKYNAGSAIPAADEIFKYAGLTMNIKTYECRLNGEMLSLTPTEFSILRILLERKCSVVSAEELFHEVWQEEYYTKSNNTITVHIRHLREKMKDTGERCV